MVESSQKQPNTSESQADGVYTDEEYEEVIKLAKAVVVWVEERIETSGPPAL